jgi:hypothetical protein
MKTLSISSPNSVANVLSATATPRLSEDDILGFATLSSALDPLKPLVLGASGADFFQSCGKTADSLTHPLMGQEVAPQDPAIAALLQSFNASPKLSQRMNGNRRARRSIRMKRMHPPSHPQKHGKGFALKLQTHATQPSHHKVMRSHAAQTAIDRYRKAKNLGDAIQPTFTAIASTLPNGHAPTDLSMGWDGTLWAIDPQGAPHIYDPINDVWNAHGKGIDAATGMGNTLYLFRGSEYVTVDVATQQTSAPVAIATTWPNLPRSFQLGVTGACGIGNTLYLFQGGWYLPVDGSQPRAKLTDIADWPTTPNWVDGVIDAVFVAPNQPDMVTLRHGAECIDLEVLPSGAFQVKGGPRPVNLSPQLEEIAAGAVTVNGGTYTYFYYTDILAQINVNALQYLPTLHQNWPATWNPTLNHAPSGRMGNLWVATTTGGIVYHDGENWNPGYGSTAGNSVSVGIDDSIWVANGQSLTNWNGGSWVEHPTLRTGISQVSVGDGSRVWVRDGQNTVLQYDSQSQQYTPNAQVGQASHIAANNDGTLWHCNNTPNAHRLVSEATSASDPLTVNAAVTSVQRVATTGFGSAHCLTQSGGSTAVYRYDSPYVFKTSKAYQYADGIISGFGKVYLKLAVANTGNLQNGLVALDAHTGEELATYPMPATPGYNYQDPVLDPIHGLVYVVSTQFDQAPGGYSELLALDAHTLTLRWSFQNPSNFSCMPTLSGTQLCLGDSFGKLYMFDTSAALAVAPGNSPQPIWTKFIGQTTNENEISLAPVIIYANVFAVTGTHSVLYDVLSDQTFTVNLSQGGNSDQARRISGKIITNSAYLFGDVQLYVPTDTGVYIFQNPIDAGPLFFQLPDKAAVYSNIAYDDGSRVGGSSNPSIQASPSLWFGDSLGRLWSIDPATAKPVTDHPPKPAYGIFTTPVIFKDSKGGATVFFGSAGDASQSDDGAWNLYGYDPDNGNLTLLPTGTTAFFSISPLNNNGVIYTGGPGSTSTKSVPQVFGIRVNMLVQALRDFIIESQLLQDPDETATGGDPSNQMPPSVCRYQTHLTVVDDNKAPRPNEAIKIWADKPNTQVTINGSPYTIGPDDSAFASVQTGADGTLTIVSNATDMFATPLRVWASFMNSYERIVVNPDQEFHQRVTTAHSDASNTDPDKANLATGTNYNGSSLFNQDEVNAGQPTNAANAVGQMKQGLNLGGTSTSTRLTYARMMQGSSLVPHSKAAHKLAAMPQSYVAYSDLHGMGYFATNIPNQRLATPAQAVGFKYSAIDKNNPGTKAQLQVMSHTDALQEIDNLTGTPWSLPTESTDLPFAPRRLGNWWTDFWSWLTNAVDQILKEVLNIVTAIGDAVMVGINLLVNGIEQVFHCKIQFLEDIASAIGSFFHMLEKALSDVLEALSLLFHFKEIIFTQQWIEKYLVGQLLSLKQTITTDVIPKTSQFFTQGKDAVKSMFSGAIAQAPTNPISQQSGVGSTTHTAYNVGSQGSNTTSSHAVQCNWGTQKLNAGLPSATSQGSSSSSYLIGDDPVSDFFNNFIQSLTNGTLSDDFSSFQSSFSSMFQSTSVSGFFQNALNSFLGLIEGLIELMFDISNDLTTGLLGIFADLIDLLIGPDGKGGILNETIEIPVLSWLFQLITGESLTLLNLITLVVAIPVTVIFRVIQGQYPSEANLPQAPASQSQQLQAEVDALPKTLQWILAIANIPLAIIGGILAALSDCGKGSSIISKCAAVIGILSIPLGLPLISEDSPSDDDWISFGLGMILYLLTVCGIVPVAQENEAAYGIVQSVIGCVQSIISLVFSSIVFNQSGVPGGWDGVAFSIAVFAVVAGIINPIKLVPGTEEVTVPTVAVFDVVGPSVAAFLGFASTYK